MIDRAHYLDLAGGKFNQTSASDLAQLFQAVEQSSAKDHLVVHFHGGLVSRKTAETAAVGLMPFYEAGGAYPVFFFWRSDLWTVLKENLNDIAQEPIFKRLVKRLVQLAAGKLANVAGARGAGEVPLPSEAELPDDLTALADYAASHEPDRAAIDGVSLSPAQIEQAETELETDDIIQAESAAIAATEAPAVDGATARTRGGVGSVAPRKTLMSKAVVSDLAEEQKGPGARLGGATFITLAVRGARVLKSVIQRYAARRDHGMYTTIVEEVLRQLYLDSLGGTAWAMMKKDTRDAFDGDPQLHGGTAFLDQLKRWWRPGRRVTLVGHSTGAIYIGHFLEKADAALDPRAKFDVVFLAPACSFEFLAARLPVFERRVARLRSFGLKDELERGYWEVPVLYPASLLYLVSGLFEDKISKNGASEAVIDQPLVGMQRYFSGDAPYITEEILAVTKYLENKCVWSRATGAPGLITSAANHSAFDEDPETLASLREFLRGGGGN